MLWKTDGGGKRDADLQPDVGLPAEGARRRRKTRTRGRRRVVFFVRKVHLAEVALHCPREERKT